MKNVPFKIVMSRGDDLRIDSDELPKVLEAISSGTPAMVRSGIFNPSFYVSIIRDAERMKAYYDSPPLFSETDNKRIEAGPEKLKDLFGDIRKLVENKKLK